MDAELKRQLDLEDSEKFFAEQKRRRAELDKKWAADDAASMKTLELELAENERRELLHRAKLKRIWESKEQIPYTADLIDYICRRVSSGEMLKAICQDQTMPTFELVQQWFKDEDKKDFHNKYLQAVSLRDRAFEDDIVIIADDSTNDYVDKVNNRTGETFRVLDPEALTRSKMRIDSRLRIMKANNPARWGDNPNAGEATKQLLKNSRPIIQYNFIEAPKDFARGNDAKVIEHKPAIEVTPVESPPWELDEHDKEYIRRRDEKAKAKVA